MRRIEIHLTQGGFELTLRALANLWTGTEWRDPLDFLGLVRTKRRARLVTA